MNAHASDRADAESAPTTESWLYRSEGFAEDLDERAPPAAAASANGTQRRPSQRAAPWSAALAGLWQARAHGAR